MPLIAEPGGHGWEYWDGIIARIIAEIN